MGEKEPKRILDMPDDTSEMHKLVDKMAELMKRELDENRDKKGARDGWLKCSPMYHVLQVYYHTGKLQVAVKSLELLRADKDSSRHELRHQEFIVQEHAADVANHALMTLDVLAMLGVPPPEPPSAPKKEEKKKKIETFNSDDVGY